LGSPNDTDIYYGVIGAPTEENSKIILDEVENLSYEDGGITELTGMAERGLEVFHAGFTNLD